MYIDVYIYIYRTTHARPKTKRNWISIIFIIINVWGESRTFFCPIKWEFWSCMVKPFMYLYRCISFRMSVQWLQCYFEVSRFLMLSFCLKMLLFVGGCLMPCSGILSIWLDKKGYMFCPIIIRIRFLSFLSCWDRPLVKWGFEIPKRVYDWSSYIYIHLYIYIYIYIVGVCHSIISQPKWSSGIYLSLLEVDRY